MPEPNNKIYNLTSVKKEDLYFFNTIRSTIVILVVLLHAVLAYCSQAKVWWIVTNEKSSLIADIIAGALDIFLMPVLFFISGYFTVSSHNKSGALSFIVKKAKNLGIPWLAGILFLNPFLVIMTRFSRGINTGSYIENIITYYSDFLKIPSSFIQDRTESPFFLSHYHFWYIALLFYFFIVYTIYKFIRSKMISKEQESGFLKNIYLQMIAVVLISAFGYSINFLIFRDSWFVFSAVQFQISRLIPYIAFYIFGIMTFKNNWVINSKIIKRPFVILFSAILLTPGYLYLYSFMMRNITLLTVLALGFFRYVICVLYLISIIRIGQQYFNKETKFTVLLNNYSFGTYIIHLNVVIVFTYIFTFNKSNNPLIQILVIFLISIFISYILNYCYQQVIFLIRRLIKK